MHFMFYLKFLCSLIRPFSNFQLIYLTEKLRGKLQFNLNDCFRKSSLKNIIFLKYAFLSLTKKKTLIIIHFNRKKKFMLFVLYFNALRLFMINNNIKV